MRVSNEGVTFVAGFEGFRTRVYHDAVGVETIGYGETAKPIIERYRAKGITPATAEQLLRDRLNHVYGKAVSDAVTVPLSQRQFDALVSFTYNLGAGALKSSSLLRYLNGGHYAKAANQFLAWNRAGGRVLPGLTRRREAERALFLRGSNRGTRIVAALQKGR
jgi:lysozyme